MTRFEELVLILWSNKGELIKQIANELGVEEDIVEDIVECEANYLRGGNMPGERKGGIL